MMYFIVVAFSLVTITCSSNDVKVNGARQTLTTDFLRIHGVSANFFST